MALTKVKGGVVDVGSLLEDEISLGDPLTHTAGWDDVPQLETETPALGGSSGIMNQQAQKLLNRTEFLRKYPGAAHDPKSRDIFEKIGEIVSVKDCNSGIASVFRSGLNVLFPDHVANISAPISVSNVQDIVITGVGNRKSIIRSSAPQILSLTGSVKNIVISDVGFECTDTTTTDKDWSGLILSLNATLENIFLIRPRFSVPGINTNAIKLIQESAKANGVYIIDPIFEDIGRMGIEVQNHVNDNVYRYEGVHIIRPKFKNIGIFSEGMGISMSGYGRRCTISDVYTENCKYAAVEVVGMQDSLIDGITCDDFSANSYAPLSVSGSRPNKGLTIRRIRALSAGSGRVLLENLQESVIDDLRLTGQLNLTNSNDNEFGDIDIQVSALNPVYIENSARNNFNGKARIKNTSTNNYSLIRFYGATTVDNVFDNAVFDAILAGTFVDNLSSASRNRVHAKMADGLPRDGIAGEWFSVPSSSPLVKTVQLQPETSWRTRTFIVTVSGCENGGGNPAHGSWLVIVRCVTGTVAVVQLVQPLFAATNMTLTAAAVSATSFSLTATATTGTPVLHMHIQNAGGRHNPNHFY